MSCKTGTHPAYVQSERPGSLILLLKYGRPNMTDRFSTRFLAAVLATGFMVAGPSARGAEPSQGNSMGYGPGMMGPGGMYNWTSEQRRQHWEQMRQRGYGPGMMDYMTPEQRRQHWEQMGRMGHGPGMMGYGPGMMSGPPRPQGAPTGSPGR